MPKVTFVNEKKEFEAEYGTTLRQVALQNGIALHHHGFGTSSAVAAVANCSALSDLLEKVVGPKSPMLNLVGGGLCGTCLVYIKEGMENCSPPSIKERCHFAASLAVIGHESEARLACQAKVQGDVSVITHPPMNLSGERFWEIRSGQPVEKE